MKKPISKLLCAIALAIASVAAARAGEVQNSSFSMTYGDNWLTPASQSGNSFTFDFADTAIYSPSTGGPGIWIDKGLYSFTAQAGYALTGKYSVTLTADYQFSVPDYPNGNASIDASFDVLLPWCSRCGMFDATLLSGARSGTLTTTGSSLQFETEVTPATGEYNHLLIYIITTGYINDYFAQIQFKTITFTAETVQASAVPELPPVAMLMLGLAVLGGYRRCVSSRNRK